MANKVTIDVEARFIDKVSSGADKASEAIKDIGEEADKARKKTENLGKKKVKPDVDANTTKFERKIKQAEERARKLGRTKTAAVITAVDKASSVINKIVAKSKGVAGKIWSAVVKVKDSNALTTLRKIGTAGKEIGGRIWSAMVKIKDYATTPLQKIKNSLFSIKSLIAAITAGFAAQQLVLKPMNLADAYSSAQIGFSTLLGKSGGQKMMDDLDAFAKKTPFNTSGVIANAQKMMAMGWAPENIIADLETIGNAAASTGKLDQGLESIVRAMSQIKTKGKLSTEELNQLAEAGIAAKAMLAENLGYGTGDAGIAAMTKDLENGAIASDKAIQALMQGMKKYDGMMESMANETVEGLWSQIQDTFEINIFRKWGQGLQDGAKRGFGTILELLDSSEGALESFGNTVYEVGKTISNWLADKLEGAVKKVNEITKSDAFKNASLGGKLKILWDGVIANPLATWWNDTVIPWWDSTAVPWLAARAGEIGKAMGSGLTNGILTLLGINVDDALADGATIGGSFMEGFLEGFDTGKITEALKEWASDNKVTASVLGAIFGGKLLLGILNAVNTFKGVFGGGSGGTGGGTGGLGGYSTATMTVSAGVVNVYGGTGVKPGVGVPTSGGTGTAPVPLLGGGSTDTPALPSGKKGFFSRMWDGVRNASIVQKLTGFFGKGGGLSKLGGTAAAGLGKFGTALGASGGAATGVGAAGAASIVAGLFNIGKSGFDIFEGFKQKKAGNNAAAREKFWTAGASLGLQAGGGAAGAGIGAVIGAVGGPSGAGAGALIGAGVGAIGGIFGGKPLGKALSKATDEGGWIDNLVKSTSKFFTETLPEKWDAFWTGVGDFFTDTIPNAIEPVTEKVSQFFTETIPEKWNEFWTGVGNFFTETIPYALGYATGKIYAFFTETVPGFFGNLWDTVAEFVTETVPEWAEGIWTNHIYPFFTETIPGFFGSLWNTVAEFFTETVPQWAEGIWNDHIVPFFTETLPGAWNTLWTAIGEFFTETLPQWAETTWTNNIVPFFTESLPGFFVILWTTLCEFFTETIPQWAESTWNDKIVPFFTEDIPSFFGDLWSDICGFFTESLPAFAEGIWSPIASFFTETIPGWMSSVWSSVSGWFDSVKNNFMSGFSAGSGGGGKARGGVVGGGSDYPGFAAGGMTPRHSKLVRVNEEGTPEMIIPLASQRRDRALKLWEKTGQMLGVGRYARGGITGGNRDEGLRFQGYGSDEAPSGQVVQIEVGGITVEINVDARGTENIAEAIRMQANEIAETVAGIMADALGGQFENTPVRGGVA